jgi:hypothetical protein
MDRLRTILVDRDQLNAGRLSLTEGLGFGTPIVERIEAAKICAADLFASDASRTEGWNWPGTTGHNSFTNMLLGTTTQKVMRTIGGAVLLVIRLCSKDSSVATAADGAIRQSIHDEISGTTNEKDYA